MDFLNALRVDTCEVTLARKSYTIEQRSLLGYYRLLVLLGKITESESKYVALDAVFDYIQTATEIEDLSSVEVEELTPALDVLVKLHKIDPLPWQTTYREKGIGSKSTADYDHRELATIVNILARAYGWTQEYILKLSPEAAFCYVQEIILDDWRSEEFQYRLSELAYDKYGKYKKYPSLNWYTDVKGKTVEEATMAVPKRHLPSGNIIDARKRNENGKT